MRRYCSSGDHTGGDKEDVHVSDWDGDIYTDGASVSTDAYACVRGHDKLYCMQENVCKN